MHFTHIVSTVVCCFIINFSAIKSEDAGAENDSRKSSEEMDDMQQMEEDILSEGHTFVALIDVVFQDGSKRSCSGAIIHDNVIVTAAHCFCHESDESVQPEITASFVVIGTKKMFAAGYEQYLPIERIVTHPKFDGWTADICLVYTFAGMTSDKPGRVIKLDGEKTSNTGDHNVTVLTWRYPKEEEPSLEVFPTHTTSGGCDSLSVEDNRNSSFLSTKFTLKNIGKILEKLKKYLFSFLFHYPSLNNRDNEDFENEGKKHHEGTQPPKWYARGNTAPSSTVTEKDLVGGLYYKYPVLLQQKLQSEKLEDMQRPIRWKDATSKKISRYLTSSEESEQQDDGIAVILVNQDQDTHTARPLPLVQQVSANRTATNAPVSNKAKATTRRSPSRVIKKQGTTAKRRQQSVRGWRRVLVTLDNKLEVERYTLVSSNNCKKKLESSLPHFVFNTGEVACYTSNEHMLTDEDSGAPAVRRSRLVAVTIGGVENDGDHIGFGLKMSCYCSWIADNIPGGSSLSCCKNCCDIKHTEPYVPTTKSKKKRKTKYL